MAINNSIFAISNEQRSLALQRLTALWAFNESGLGGVLHAFKLPFTGLLVGGFAVVLICFIASFSKRPYQQILHSLWIVLVVKALVSPHTPPMAYLAVTFQAVIGLGLFNLLGINFFSILLFGISAMLESALQKLITLTLFFGQSFWKAFDSLVSYAASQFYITSQHISYWIVGIYLGIYFLGGIGIAWLSYHLLYNFDAYSNPIAPPLLPYQNTTLATSAQKPKNKKRFTKQMLGTLLLLVGIAVVLFLFAPNSKLAWVGVLKSVSWTLSALILWYGVISPLFVKLIGYISKQQQSTAVTDIISFLPILRQLSWAVWEQSKEYGGNRIFFFVRTLLYATLTYTEPQNIDQ